MSNTVALQFQEPDGTIHDVNAPIGKSLMEVAVMSNVPGIEAECGGCCNCATCHVFVPEQVAGPGDEEDAMLDETAIPRTANSRLSCQIIVAPELEGGIFSIPHAQ